MHYHNITKDDMLNGDGLRVVLWLSGCSHACEGCHNAITWDCNGGALFDETAKKEVFDALENDYVSGVTLSGGDPLFMGNREEVFALIKEIKETFPNKSIWLYTGYSWNEIKELNGIEDIDVLVDGKFIQSLQDVKLHWCGSSNQKVIDVKKTLLTNQIVLHSI